MYRKGFSFISILFLAASCTTDPVLTDPDSFKEYFVFCTLTPKAEYQQVVLCRMLPENLPGRITDADVSIGYGQKAVWLGYDRDFLYRDEEKKLLLVPGETYILNIRLKDGTKLIGSTSIPGSFSITSPCPGDTLDYRLASTSGNRLTFTDSIRFSNVSSGARFYRFWMDVRIKGYTALSFETAIIPAPYPEIMVLSGDFQQQRADENIVQSGILNVVAFDSTHRMTPNWYENPGEMIDLTGVNFYYHMDKMKLNGCRGVFNASWWQQVPVVVRLNLEKR